MEFQGKQLSEQLRSAIRESGRSLYEIAKETGVDEGNLGRFVHGKGGLRLKSLDRIGDLLRLKLSKDR